MTMLSIVIPAYNEENGIADIANRVLSIRGDLQKVGVAGLELLVVDDGSSDRTAEIAGSIDGVELIRHRKNQGYGAALKTGFCHARGELIGFLDADGTYPPEYFPRLCEIAMAGHDLVIGSRMAGSESGMPLTRRIGNLFFANLLSLISNERVTDSASGMRVFRKDVLQRIYPLPDGLNLTPVMSTRAIHEGIRMIEEPIPYSERVGRSKLSVVRDGSVFLQSMIWTALTYNPVRILGLIGLGGVGLALLVLLGIIIARLNGITTIGPWGVAAIYTALVAGLTGISTYCLGVIFNYLVSLFYKRPVRQGLLKRSLFSTSIERHFGWIGLLSIASGLVVGIISLTLSLQGWDIARLWLYMLGSAMFILIGVQLLVNWVVLRVLEELSRREERISEEFEVDLAFGD